MIVAEGRGAGQYEGVIKRRHFSRWTRACSFRALGFCLVVHQGLRCSGGVLFGAIWESNSVCSSADIYEALVYYVVSRIIFIEIGKYLSGFEIDRQNNFIGQETSIDFKKYRINNDELICIYNVIVHKINVDLQLLDAVAKAIRSAPKYGCMGAWNHGIIRMIRVSIEHHFLMHHALLVT